MYLSWCGAVASVISCYTTYTFEPLRTHAHTQILSCVNVGIHYYIFLCTQLEPLLAKSPKDRQSFVTSGALHRLQIIMTKHKLKEPSLSHALSISSLFPEDVVKYYAGT
jgi:hypothetical protein